MTSKKQRKVPELRFRGFTDDWEQRKLGGIYSKIRNAFVGTATPYYVTQGHFYLESNNVKNGKINRNTEVYINDAFYHRQKENWLHTGDIVVVQSGHVGHSAVIPPELNNTAAHALIIIANPTESVDPYFVNNYLQTARARRDIMNITTGNTIQHILASEMKKFQVTLPQFDEQKKISELIMLFDDAIALHQRKQSLLEKLKQGYLQKLFPQKGQRQPELRFSGFTDDWEQRKLGNITESFSGGTPSVTNSAFYGGAIPFIRSAEIHSDTTELSITEEAIKSSSAKMVHKGDILYALYGATSGQTDLSKINGAINQAILALRPTKNVHSEYLVQWLAKEKETIISRYLQGGQGNLSASIVKQLIIPMSVNELENKAIGNLFQQLDDVIALHQQEIDRLQQLKQGYLQKMFV